MEERIKRVGYRIIASGIMGIGFMMLRTWEYPIMPYGGAVFVAGLVTMMILTFV